MKRQDFSSNQMLEIKRLYTEEHLSTDKVGMHFNVSRTVIKRVLSSQQISIRNLSDCHKGQIAWNKGRQWSQEIKKKISLKAQNRFGSKNSNWKGGKAWKADRRRNLKVVKEWRKKCLELDKFQCAWCTSKKRLEVNHIIPIRQIQDIELLCDIDNGITLCRKCHQKIHYHEQEYTDLFRKLLKNRVNSGNILRKRIHPQDNPDPSLQLKADRRSND